MGFSLALVTLFLFFILDRIPGFQDKFPAPYTVVFPLSAIIFAIFAELLIFRMGMSHLYWIAGAMVGSFVGLSRCLREI